MNPFRRLLAFRYQRRMKRDSGTFRAALAAEQRSAMNAYHYDTDVIAYPLEETPFVSERTTFPSDSVPWYRCNH